ncbi:MAG: hypothetical protein AVDCRST_MAG22-44 [uncultured Rubrobacteraceae bacterium]|uniref:Sulfotransferase domain-containing protein n=1 Tax=uncultured Rubrobacteraceae bacterium TaxID=349277 RepID=A0A6J4N9W2_9ACTN|nr:MAG: hypothetical protein AVDCRST_MAG22-44 [uncultured Rubrobacteraceae bacterium]
MPPDFIGIGAQKAGTTWLHRNLQVHPGIFMPRKEVHYFDRKMDDHSDAVSRLLGKRTVDEQWRRQTKHWLGLHLRTLSFKSLLWDLKYYMRRYDDDWYDSVFEPSGGRVAGEITPAYSALGEEKVTHAHGLAPEAKIIFMMRNPIERVWSHTVMSFDKVEKGSAGSVSQRKLLRKVGRDSSRSLTDYLRTLETWRRFYPDERIFVGFLEDVHFFPEELLRAIYGFLDVDPSFRPPAPEKKVHVRSDNSMPAGVAVELARTFGGQTERLEERLGGYASFWRFCAERLAEDPPEGSVAYPLWSSPLWEEWTRESAGTDAARPRFQSGPLASLEPASRGE